MKKIKNFKEIQIIEIPGLENLEQLSKSANAVVESLNSNEAFIKLREAIAFNIKKLEEITREFREIEERIKSTIPLLFKHLQVYVESIQLSVANLNLNNERGTMSASIIRPFRPRSSDCIVDSIGYIPIYISLN